MFSNLKMPPNITLEGHLANTIARDQQVLAQCESQKDVEKVVHFYALRLVYEAITLHTQIRGFEY
ncbi:MAG: hypothetical protein OHK0057_08890 [Thermoflexibacter sp.]